jgi:hypothetical protein
MASRCGWDAYPPSAVGEIEQLMTADERYVRQVTGLAVHRMAVPGRVSNVVPR